MDSMRPFAFPLNDADIQKIEKKIGCTLPSDYVDFLRNHGNGGVFLTPGGSRYACFMCSAESGMRPEPIAIDRFFSIGIGLKENQYDVEMTYESLLSAEPGYPSDFLPIGSTDAGDTVAMRVSESQKGEIKVFWYDRHCSEASFVARSFTEFMEGITLVQF
jgi:cell wall assembly regulator SMI1